MKQKPVSNREIEDFHFAITRPVEAGKYDSYIESLTQYVTDNNIDIDAIKALLSPKLKVLLHDEGVTMRVIKPNAFSTLAKNLFQS